MRCVGERWQDAEALGLADRGASPDTSPRRPDRKWALPALSLPSAVTAMSALSINADACPSPPIRTED
jgi:hypothetical protein